MEAIPLLLQPVLPPLAAGLICWILGRRLAALSRLLASLATAASLVLAAGIWRLGDVAWAPAAPFLSLGTADLQIALRATPFSSLLALAACGFAALVVLYSWGYSGIVASEGKYYAYLLWSLAATVAAFYANDLFFLLVCWEVLSLCLYLLIGLGREETAPAGAAKTFAILGFSDCCLLLGIALVLALQGTLQMDALRVETGSLPAYLTFLLFLCAALAKAGAIPLHSWIPTASEGAPIAVMAYLPAALDKLLGIYLLARICFDFFALDAGLRALLMVVGAATILAAVLMAMVQHDLRRLLSFHAVSQVGYMVLGLATGTVIGIVGGLFHMFNHAIYKSCLFLCAGQVEERTGRWELDRLGGLARRLPVAFVGCGVAALAISGVPPLNGFASKWLVYQSLLAQQTALGAFVLVVAVFGSALTLASFVKVMHSCFWGPPPADLELHLPYRPWATAVPIAVLALLCVGLGLGARYPVDYLTGIAVAELGKGVGVAAGPLDYGTGIWSPSTATLLLLAGIVLGLIVYALGRVSQVRTVGSFVGGEVLPGEEVRYAGTSFYETIRHLPGLRVLFKDGQAGAYDLYELGGYYGGNLVQVLRRLHTGVLLVYVSWCIVGGVLILGFLLRG